MTLDELKEYVRNMPEDEILTVRFEEYKAEGEDEHNGRNDRNDRDEAV
ncbi:MAG: hypothetical protein IJW67_10060 [Blautia sp.]|nr:hypothetical protein [Blautia sp.]